MLSVQRQLKIEFNKMVVMAAPSKKAQNVASADLLLVFGVYADGREAPAERVFAQVSNAAGRCERFKEQQQSDLMDLVDGIGDGEWPDGYLGIILVDKRLPLVDQHESAQLPKWLLDQQRGSFASISEDAMTVLLIDIVCVVAVEYANIKCVPLGSRVIRRLGKLVVDNRRPPLV